MGDHGDLVARLVAAQRDLVGVQQQLHLRGHGVEDGVGGRPFRDERRHPPERGLLLGEPFDLRARLRVGDGRRQQVAELREAPLGFRRQRLALEPRDADHAPYAPVYQDGTADSRADPVLVAMLGDRARSD